MLLKTCSFHKLGGVERWAGRSSVQPATMFRRIFNYLSGRTAIDFGSEASEQSTGWEFPKSDAKTSDIGNLAFLACI